MMEFYLCFRSWDLDLQIKVTLHLSVKLKI